MHYLKTFTLLIALMTATNLSAAPDAKHRIAFEVTMAGDEEWNGVLNNVKNIRVALGKENTEVIVIAHSNGLGLLVKKDNKPADRIKELADDGVVFAACENTMKKKNVTKENLLSSATTVDSGVAEVVRRQEAGWSYLKSGS